MRRLRAFLLALAFTGCASPTEKVDLEIKNETGQTITIDASTGRLRKRIRIGPGATWSGWLSKTWVSDKMMIRIEPK